ncbi:MAG: sulfurtransferase-like selenium metabolism protein YedF [Cellulosilyticaceae bacterium]
MNTNKITIDAIGKACPMPVIMAKKEIDGGNTEFDIIVDNAIAVENVRKLAKTSGYSLESSEVEGNYHISLIKDGSEAKTIEVISCVPTTREDNDWTLFVRSNVLGIGDDTLGEGLMKMFFYTLGESEKAPKQIVFVNGGVKLPCEDEQVIEHLKKLEEQGSEILVCGTCLNFYKIADKLKVGNISNMYDIVGSITNTAKVVTL